MKETWSHLISFCGLILLFALSTFDISGVQHPSNQSSRPLSLKERLIEGEITDIGSYDVRVRMKFNIEIKNVGAIPALILKQELLAIDRTILDTPDPSPDRYLFRLVTGPSNGRNAEWQKLQRDIYKPFPPSRLIRTLAPNETWTSVPLMLCHPASALKGVTS